jgi:hypothetical protein
LMKRQPILRVVGESRQKCLDDREEWKSEREEGC